MRPLQVGNDRITLPILRPASKSHEAALVVTINYIESVVPVRGDEGGGQRQLRPQWLAVAGRTAKAAAAAATDEGRDVSCD